jgi:nicotinate-nucleotide adenylyltransferase
VFAMKTIALFGGSFNPPHVGHRQVMKHLASIRRFDEVWVVPTYSHPYEKDLISYEDRVKMCELTLHRIEARLTVCSIEGELKKSPSYTIDTIRELKKRYPDVNFWLALGSDCRDDILNWKLGDQLIREVEFYFIPRAGYEPSTFMDISSSKVRQMLQLGVDCCGVIPDGVMQYIEDRGLYRIEGGGRKDEGRSRS